MSLAYFFNCYPQPSLTAQRRELDALERLGVEIHRFTLRRFKTPLIDEADRAEQDRTRVLLNVGAIGLLLATARAALTRPSAFIDAFRAAVRLGRVSEAGLLYHFIYLTEACVLLGWLKELQVEHIHTHYGTNSATVVMLCRLLGGPPYSFSMHGPEEFDSPRALSLREKMHHAKFVVAITEFTRSQLYRWASYEDWSKIHVIRVGLGPEYLNHGVVPIPAAPRFVNIGRLVEQKGQAILIKAAAMLRDKGHDFELVIIGYGSMFDELQRLIDRLDLGRQVRLAGYLGNDEVFQEILAARALVLPSFAEGLPGVFFEAFALGRPVLTTYIAGHPELIEPGVNGWLIPAGAVEPLADAMAEILLADPAQLERMGREGAAMVAERHDAEIEAAKLLRLFRGLPADATADSDHGPPRHGREGDPVGTSANAPS